MAYGLIIAAVKPEKFADFKLKLREKSADINPLPFLEAEKIVITTHYHLSAGTGDQALNSSLADLFESGEIIDSVYWHPYRAPLYLDHNIVLTKIPAFKKAYTDLISKIPEDEVQFWHMDFSPIMNLVDFAAQHYLSLITFLDKPMDKERADKVQYPINIQAEQ